MGKLLLASYIFLVPDGKPGNIRVSANSSSTHYVITWDEIKCSRRNGNVIGYTYKLTSATNMTNEVIIPETEVNKTIVTIPVADLGRYIPYTFSVAGRTSAGIGLFGSLVIDLKGKLKY